MRTPGDAKVLDGLAPTLSVPRYRCRGAYGHRLVRGRTTAELARSEQGLDLDALMVELAERQCNEILVESGPRLAGSLLQAGLLDELIVYLAPTLMGDRARPLLQLPFDSMSEKIDLQVADVRRVGSGLAFYRIARLSPSRGEFPYVHRHYPGGRRGRRDAARWR